MELGLFGLCRDCICQDTPVYFTYVYITYVFINKQLSCGLFKMIQPQRYPKERERNKKNGVGGGDFFFPSRHLIYSVTLMLINNA